MPLALTRAHHHAHALDLAHAAWRETGGLLVVSDRDAATRALLRAARTHGVVLGRDAVTFAALRSRIHTAAGAPAPDPPAAVRVRLELMEALGRCTLPALGEAASAPGFLAVLERAIGELREGRLDAAEVRATSADPVIADLATIHEAASGVRLPADERWRAVELAAGLDAFPPVAVAGFDDLAPPEWALLHALGERTGVTVVMPFAAGRRAFQARDARQERWSAEADPVSDAQAPAGDRRPASLEALSATLFEDRPPPPGDDGAVCMVGAAGTRGMHRLALEEVLRVHADGVTLAECALVVPRLAAARDDLDRLLRDWGVPARRVTRRRVLETPLGLALTQLLHLGEMEPGDPGALGALLGWLRTPYSGADADEVDRFERDALRAGLAERGRLMARWDGDVIAPARRLVRASAQGLRAQLAALVDAGMDGLRRVVRGGLAPTPADALDRSALAAIAGVLGSIDDEDAPADEGAPRTRGPMPPGELGLLLADLTFADESGPPEGLALLDYATVRARSFRMVVLCGLDGAGFPAGPSADALLGPLRAPLAGRLLPRAPGTSESRLRFLHAVTAATERLVMVRRVVDDDGRELAPSPYWVEACRVLGRDAEALDRRTGARGELVDDLTPAPTRREALRLLAADRRIVPGELADAVARRTRRLGVAPGTFDHLDEFHVTELEAYLRCPYGWLTGSYLRPRPLEPPFDAAFEGTLGHAVMQRLYEKMLTEGAGPCTPAALPQYTKALPGVVGEAADAARPQGVGAGYEVFVERLRVHLEALLEGESGLLPAMTPSEFERTLADDDLLGLSPPARLSGRVDRVDVSPGGEALVVIDYKRTGGKLKRDGEVVDRLQLPLYGLMASRALAGTPLPSGGLYVGLLNGDRHGAISDDVNYAGALPQKLGIADGDWRQMVADATEAARAAAAGIRGGRLEGPRPSGCDWWCRCGDLWR